MAMPLARGHDPEPRDSPGQTPIVHAARQGNVSGVKILLGYGKGLEADAADSKDATPLTHAVRGGHGAIVDLLLLLIGQRVDVNHRDTSRQAALLWVRRERRWDTLV